MQYAAFLRGIGPADPRMANDSLRGLFQVLGFQSVQTVLSSGNVVFESGVRDAGKLESIIEKALPQKLGFALAVFVRSQDELRSLIDSRPFGDREHSPQTNLNITLLRRAMPSPWKFPYRAEGYIILDMRDRTIFSVADTLANKAPDLMRQLDKATDKENTTRTLLTMQRVLKKMEASNDK